MPMTSDEDRDAMVRLANNCKLDSQQCAAALDIDIERCHNGGIVEVITLAAIDDTVDWIESQIRLAYYNARIDRINAMK